MIISACSTQPSVKCQPLDDNQEIEILTEELDNQLDPIFLEECQWLDIFVSTDLEDIYQTIQINHERYRECYILNNMKIDILKSRY